MKFGQLTEPNEGNIFLEKSGKNKAGLEASSRRLTFLKKKISTLAAIYFGNPLLGHKTKRNYEFSICWSRDMLNFSFFSKMV